MTFLELCKRARQEMGISGTGPARVSGQSGESKRIVDWVSSAYDDICLEHMNWKFLRSRFSVQTVAGTEAYLPSSCTDTKLSIQITADSFGKWVTEKFDTFRIYLTSDGSSTQQNIWPKDYDWFRFTYQMRPPSNGRPVDFAIRDDGNAILLGPKPNDNYTVVGEYYRVAQPLSSDNSEPLIPERFNMAIVWRAVRSYAGYEEDGGLYQHADNMYKRIHGALLVDQLPRIKMAGPMA